MQPFNLTTTPFGIWDTWCPDSPDLKDKSPIRWLSILSSYRMYSRIRSQIAGKYGENCATWEITASQASRRSRDISSIDSLMPCWDMLRLSPTYFTFFYDSFCQTLKCFSCRTYASNQQCKANWHEEAHLLTNPALRHSERIWEHLNTSFLHVFVMPMHFWNSWGSTMMSRTSHVILNDVNLIQH